MPSPRFNIYGSNPRIPTYSEELTAALQISDPAIRAARVATIKAKRILANNRPASPRAQAAGNGNSPMDPAMYRDRYQKIFRETAGNASMVSRWPRLNALAEEYKMSHLTPESRETLEKAKELQNNPHARMRYANFIKTDAYKFAADEAKLIDIPSVH